MQKVGNFKLRQLMNVAREAVVMMLAAGIGLLVSVFIWGQIVSECVWISLLGYALVRAVLWCVLRWRRSFLG